MVVQRKDSGEVDTCVAEQKVDVEEGGASLEDERGTRVGGRKKVGRYNGDDADSGVEDEDDEVEEDVEKNDVEDVNVDAEG